MFPIFKHNKNLSEKSQYSQLHVRIQLIVKQLNYSRTQGALYSNKIIARRNMPRNLLFKLTKITDNGKILKSTREKQQIM